MYLLTCGYLVVEGLVGKRQGGQDDASAMILSQCWVALYHGQGAWQGLKLREIFFRSESHLTLLI